MKKKEVIKRLKPFWEKYWELENDFRRKQNELESEMSKKIDQKIKLEFFYVDGQCVGIGTECFLDREKFPLIQSSDF